MSDHVPDSTVPDIFETTSTLTDLAFLGHHRERLHAAAKAAKAQRVVRGEALVVADPVLVEGQHVGVVYHGGENPEGAGHLSLVWMVNTNAEGEQVFDVIDRWDVTGKTGNTQW